MSLTLKEKLLRSFDNPVYNTFTTAQAAARYGVSPGSVTKAVRELRLEGKAIYRNRKSFEGRTINVYRLGKPSKRFTRNMRAGRTEIALAALDGRV
jgi:predicted ArsR family transcriptional regulator